MTEGGAVNKSGARGSEPSFQVVDKGVSVAAQIANQLVSAIRAEELTVGERLPSESELATRFGVSRASVREALSSLQFSGYLETVRGLGTVVISNTAIGQNPILETGIRRPCELIDVVEARLLVEPEVIRQAALDPLPSTLRTAERMLEGMQVSLAVGRHDEYSDLGLHRALIRSCRNSVLVEMAERLIAQSEGRLWRQVRHRAWAETELPKLWLTHHIAMADAVMKRDPGTASEASRDHLMSVLANAGRSMRLTKRDRVRIDGLLAGRFSRKETN